MDPRWKHPYTSIISGPTSCGKTEWVLKFIRHIDQMMTPPPQKIIWFYGEWQEAYTRPEICNVHFVEGLPREDMIDPSIINLIIIDDLLGEADKRVTKLFTKGSHHKNCSVMFIVQNIFDKNKEMRTISLNAHYTVAFKNPRDMSQIHHLARQMYPGNTKFVLEAFKDATAQPYGYLLFDGKASTPDEIRIRTNLFPGEMITVYINKANA